MKSRGVKLIAAERQRQVQEEGWTPEHDDEHAGGQLAVAGAVYAFPHAPTGVPSIWPFQTWWWKPTPDDRVRELVKAGALIAAEIDRLLRERR